MISKLFFYNYLFVILLLTSNRYLEIFIPLPGSKYDLAIGIKELPNSSTLMIYKSIYKSSYKTFTMIINNHNVDIEKLSKMGIIISKVTKMGIVVCCTSKN